MLKKALAVLFFITFSATAVNAELSTNPWATANDAEEVEKIYQKNRRKNNNGRSSYTPEAATVVDRTAAYIEIEEETDEDQSFLGKITSPFAKKEKKLISNTSSNRKALARQRAAAQQSQTAETVEDSDSGFSLPNFSNPLKKLNMPNVNPTSLIQKFERASGINLKAIGKSFK
ncbi:MAG: hypothetical protein J6A09_00585 [Alphaproteobacteria bacterium]|nr:hypothetical protein [Alphaproteobacteria bacterium]